MQMFSVCYSKQAHDTCIKSNSLGIAVDKPTFIKCIWHNKLSLKKINNTCVIETFLGQGLIKMIHKPSSLLDALA